MNSTSRDTAVADRGFMKGNRPMRGAVLYGPGRAMDERRAIKTLLRP
jgi:hypothetical protein